MKILWLCNTLLPVIGEHLGLEGSNKEGWISGLLHRVLQDVQQEVQPAIAFPVGKNMLVEGQQVLSGSLQVNGRVLQYFGFYEDTDHPEYYDKGLEECLGQILQVYRPDIVHIFGTEYPHTLAMTRVFDRPEHLLIGVQGLCAECAHAYFANLPEKVIYGNTFRDWLKKDGLQQQYEKFVKRGAHETEAVKNAENITGRTDWDRECTGRWNEKAEYYKMNETLRQDFYTEVWKEEQAEPYTIFLSQGDYPLKGLHYVLLALPTIRKVYPEVKVYVAGNPIIRDKSLLGRLKVSAYGKYIENLIEDLHLQEAVVFLGKLTGAQMKEQYLKSGLFVCCSSVENSPNSLGEAMLLGMPCVAADVGGISSIMTGGEDGILYQGFCHQEEGCDLSIQEQEMQLKAVADNLAQAVIEMWSNPEKRKHYCENARKHAKVTHDGDVNFGELLAIYRKIMEK